MLKINSCQLQSVEVRYQEEDQEIGVCEGIKSFFPLHKLSTIDESNAYQKSMKHILTAFGI